MQVMWNEKETTLESRTNYHADGVQIILKA